MHETTKAVILTLVFYESFIHSCQTFISRLTNMAIFSAETVAFLRQ